MDVGAAQAQGLGCSGRQGVNRNDWLNERLGKWRQKKGAHYVLDNISAPLQDGKTEPVPSDYLPDTSSTLNNFLKIFLWLYFEGKNSEL